MAFARHQPASAHFSGGDADRGRLRGGRRKSLEARMGQRGDLQSPIHQRRSAVRYAQEKANTGRRTAAVGVGLKSDHHLPGTFKELRPSGANCTRRRDARCQLTSAITGRSRRQESVVLFGTHPYRIRTGDTACAVAPRPRSIALWRCRRRRLVTLLPMQAPRVCSLKRCSSVLEKRRAGITLRCLM